MAITANNTTLTFNDATTQTTSGVTAVNVSTGISSTGGKTPTLTNTGVTSVTAGTGISVSASTGGVTITNTSSASGTVTSVATGNGLSGGTITSTGTLVIACPTFNTVGSYVMGGTFVGGGNTVNLASGSNYSAGTGTNQIRSVAVTQDGVEGPGVSNANNLSGSWKWMAASASGPNIYGYGICCRVS
jgi:hypothetical protein